MAVFQILAKHKVDSSQNYGLFKTLKSCEFIFSMQKMNHFHLFVNILF